MRYAVVAVLLLASFASAQDLSSSAMKKGATEISVWTGGGSGLGQSSSVQFFNLGGRLGKVLTGEHGPGPLRGNFEYAFDVAPVYLVIQDGVTYGGSVSPLILKWNFTSGRKVVPFVAIEETALFTTRNVPPGDTATVNFCSGVGFGAQVFQRERRSVSVSGHLMHISNASIGNQNPGYNVVMQFRVGYQWWK